MSAILSQFLTAMSRPFTDEGQIANRVMALSGLVIPVYTAAFYFFHATFGYITDCSTAKHLEHDRSFILNDCRRFQVVLSYVGWESNLNRSDELPYVPLPFDPAAMQSVQLLITLALFFGLVVARRLLEVNQVDDLAAMVEVRSARTSAPNAAVISTANELLRRVMPAGGANKWCRGEEPWLKRFSPYTSNLYAGSCIRLIMLRFVSILLTIGCFYIKDLICGKFLTSVLTAPLAYFALIKEKQFRFNDFFPNRFYCNSETRVLANIHERTVLCISHTAHLFYGDAFIYILLVVSSLAVDVYIILFIYHRFLRTSSSYPYDKAALETQHITLRPALRTPHVRMLLDAALEKLGRSAMRNSLTLEIGTRQHMRIMSRLEEHHLLEFGRDAQQGSNALNLGTTIPDYRRDAALIAQTKSGHGSFVVSDKGGQVGRQQADLVVASAPGADTVRLKLDEKRVRELVCRKFLSALRQESSHTPLNTIEVSLNIFIHQPQQKNVWPIVQLADALNNGLVSRLTLESTTSLLREMLRVAEQRSTAIAIIRRADLDRFFESIGRFYDCLELLMNFFSNLVEECDDELFVDLCHIFAVSTSEKTRMEKFIDFSLHEIDGRIQALFAKFIQVFSTRISTVEKETTFIENIRLSVLRTLVEYLASEVEVGSTYGTGVENDVQAGRSLGEAVKHLVGEGNSRLKRLIAEKGDAVFDSALIFLIDLTAKVEDLVQRHSELIRKPHSD